ncbi:PIR protein [Plasmodium ovale]|uniref:PIR Superfamily Protein n=2 Tax=Plasmodium ovale TaxID=36330 RepID=A0A1A8WQB1_PLAOA|nr:PIR Superfamily Protein [Plasmodium ovale curtisi]SBS99872.1 PIR Superfamily Protein [Plasmodium ovale curtisi]SBT84997.1 PIR protein [Plasmodium ovale]
MEDPGERKTITYDMVDMLYLNSTNMGMAETFTQKTPNPQFASTCDSIFTNRHNSNSIHKDICKTLLAYFHLSKISGGSNDPNSYCRYSNYWLNKKVRKENGTLEEYASSFFNIFASSTNGNFTSSECKNYVYDLGDDTFKKMKILFTYHEHYSNFILKKQKEPDLSCVSAQECAKIYKENIFNCSSFEDKYCAKLKGFRDKLMRDLKSLKMCSDTQDIISSIDKTITESSSQNQREESSQATTISASSLGTMMGVSLLSLFLYKVTPLGSWLSSRIGNFKKTLNIGDNEENESLFQYSESTESNYTNGDYNIAYHFVGNS